MALPTNNKVSGATIYSPLGDVKNITICDITFTTGSATTYSVGDTLPNANIAFVGGEFNGSETMSVALFDHWNQQWKNRGYKDVTFSGFTCNSAETDYRGGLIRSYQSNVFMENATFRDNAVSGSCTVLYANSWETFIKDCTFIGNTATKDGGVIGSWTTMHISGSTFYDNCATHGGAIVLNASNSVTIESNDLATVFDSNYNAVHNGTFNISANATAKFFNDKSDAVTAMYFNIYGTAIFSGNAGSAINLLFNDGSGFATSSTLTVSGSLIAETASDKVSAYHITLESGAYIETAADFNASVSTISVTDTDFKFDNTQGITISAMDFKDTASTITFAGNAQVNFTVTNEQAQDLSKVGISVSADVLNKNNGHVIANNIALGENQTITVGEKQYAIGQEFVTGDYAYSFANANNQLTLAKRENATISDGAVIDTNFINEGSESLITGGEINAVFVGTDLTSGNVNTEVQDGKFSKFFVGGALVKTEAA
ncbi:MAG: hypothetical protein IKA71_03925, partial [Lentisphaeria bacterium]|nr:hypothetical protein [Lentisphaeria bacterium]